MSERERADQQAGDDLVADAEEEGSVEHLVRQSDARGHGDHLTAEERQLHAGTALGDAVAHRRYAARELRYATCFAYGLLQPCGVLVERLVSGQQVVVRGDDRYAGFGETAYGQAVGAFAGGETVGEVAARHSGAGGSVGGHGSDSVEVGVAGLGAAFGDTTSDIRDYTMHLRPPDAVETTALASGEPSR
ncbi:hypothetical protein GCM10029964_024340 [Kibdelosporangium lantanae]